MSIFTIELHYCESCKGSRTSIECHHCRVFAIIHADEYTLTYMEAHPQTFRAADSHAILSKMAQELAQQSSADMFLSALSACAGTCGCVGAPTLLRVTSQVAGLALQRHEAITLARKLACSCASSGSSIALEPLRMALELMR